jgi:hypothetical protein
MSFISGHAADFASFSIRFAQPNDDDTSYADTGTGSSHAGAGTVDYTLNAAGFLAKGAASTAPGIDNITGTGGTVTATLDTGCTEAGTFIITGGNIDHAKRRGAIPISFEAINDGDVTETWAIA